MGKGDKKTKKGKVHIGSYGVRRPKKDNTVDVKAKTKSKTAKKGKK